MFFVLRGCTVAAAPSHKSWLGIPETKKKIQLYPRDNQQWNATCIASNKGVPGQKLKLDQNNWDTIQGQQGRLTAGRNDLCSCHFRGTPHLSSTQTHSFKWHCNHSLKGSNMHDSHSKEPATETTAAAETAYPVRARPGARTSVFWGPSFVRVIY